MASSNAVGDEQPKKRQRLGVVNANSDGNGEVPMRTVYIDGLEPDMYDEINSHFGQFGKIESVTMHFGDTGIWNEWCLVQFKRAKDADEALLRTGNKWMDCDVKAADPWHQPDHPLQVARPDQDSDSNISVALNDDCLQEIFRRLKLSSLTNVAGVCKRFNEQAKIVFALKYKHLNLFEQFHYHQDMIETAMETFGKEIQSLIIDATSFSKEADAFHLIGQYCGPKLKQLELHHFRFQTDPRSMRPIFAGIERVKLEFCANSIGLGELMAGCVELKTLKIWYHRDAYQCIAEQTFPKLEEFSINQTYVSDELFERFLIRHPTLIKLSIINATFDTSVFRAISQHAANLQELEFDQGTILRNNNYQQFRNDVACIGQLRSLKKLHLDMDPAVLITALNALVVGSVPIESLEVKFSVEPIQDDAIQCISQLKKIKILHLKTDRWLCVTDAHVIEVAKCLPELEELHLNEFLVFPNNFKTQLSTIDLRKMLMHANKLKLLKLHWIDSIEIDVDDYKAMLDIVQQRKEKVPLVIEIHGEKDQVDVPAAVLAENQTTFNIIFTKH